MARKNKNKKAKSRQKINHLHNQSAGGLIKGARASLEAGKARNAVEALKAALKQKDCPEQEAQLLLFRAYLARAQELRKKGMDVEADTVMAQAHALNPEPRDMEPETLSACIANLGPDEAFALYRRYIEHHDAPRIAEHQLVNHLLVSRNWDLLKGLDENAPLLKDAEAAKQAVSCMGEGGWEAGLDALRPVARSSPYAPLRLLCRAIKAFSEENDQELQKIAAMLPEDFLLSSPIKELAEYLNDTSKETDAPSAGISRLLEGPLGARGKMKRLVEAVKKHRHNDAAREIKQVSQEIYPEDPVACIEAIMDILSRYALSGYFGSTDFYYELTASVLPRNKAGPLLLRIDMETRTPLSAAALYLDYLPEKFSDPRLRAAAKSQLLLHAVERSFTRKTLPYEFEEGLGAYMIYMEDLDWSVLGIKSRIPETAWLEAALEGIASDPENRDWYALVAKLPRSSREEKRLVEKAFETMAEHFPDDPFPYLELAALYQHKSAFRKAEKAIEEAARRAPYDNRVIDRKAISLLISAEKNLARGRYHLVGADLERAEALASRRAGPYLRAKQAVLMLHENRLAPAAAMEWMIEPLTGLSRARALILFALGFGGAKPKDGGRASRTAITKEASGILKTELQKIDALDAAGFRRLINPVSPEFQEVVPHWTHQAVAALLPKREISRLLPGIGESDILSICDLLLEMGWFATARKELSRRVKKGGRAGRPVIDFYQAVLSDLSGEMTDAEYIEEIIEAADPETDAKLEKAAATLSRYARGRLRMALQLFDFDIIRPLSPIIDGFEEDDEIDDLFPPEQAPPAGDNADTGRSEGPSPEKMLSHYSDMSPSEVIEELEGIVDRMRFRGSPDYVLRTMRPVVFNSRPETEYVKELFNSYPPDVKETLSREAAIFFLEEP